MSQKLSGKVAVVTGASKGIGPAIATHLAAEGAAVVVNYASGKAGAERVVADIKNKGGRYVIDAESIERGHKLEQMRDEADDIPQPTKESA